jgi:hypothetical protein
MSRSFEFWTFEFVSACDELSRVDFMFRISDSKMTVIKIAETILKGDR